VTPQLGLPPGRRLGCFVLRERFDQGGFGAIYLADQPPLGRQVVVKVLHQRADVGAAALVRFDREAKLASKLDHPFAAHIYASGIEPDGLIWISMELVRGVTLKRWLDQHGGRMPLDVLVPLFERICNVVQVAHERGIVHRDIKPANVMVVERAGELLPKLVDFGLAKAIGEVAPAMLAESSMQIEDTQLVSCSRSSVMLGTPPYMAPEIWAGAEAGPASDVYALGVVAFQALTGRSPFLGSGPAEVGVQHVTAEIPTVGDAYPAGLDAVFARALAKHPMDRYDSPLELAAALREVADARIAAQVRTAARVWADRGRPADLLWRGSALEGIDGWTLETGRELSSTEIAFVAASRDAELEAELAGARRRRRTKCIGTAIASVMAAMGVALFLGRATYETRLAQQRAVDAEHERAVAEIAAEVEQGRAALLAGDYAGARQHLGEAWRMGDHSRTTAFMLARAEQPLRAELARLPAVSGRMWAASWSPDGSRILTADDRAAQIWDADTHQRLFTLPHHDTVYDARWLDGGRRVVTACGDGAVRIWSAETGELVRELRPRSGSLQLARVAATLNGELIAAIDDRGAAAVAWSAVTGTELVDIMLDGAEWTSLAFSADGHWLAAGGGDVVRVISTETWRAVATLSGPGIHAIAWDLTGPRLATVSALGDASIWNVPAGTRARHLRDVGPPIEAVATSPDGRFVALGGRDGSEQVFDAVTGKLMSTGRMRDRILSLRFDARSQIIAIAGADGTAEVIEASTGQPIAVLSGPAAILRMVSFDPDGRRVVGASWDGTARIWDARAPYQRQLGAPIAAGCGLVGGASPDSRVVAIACPGYRTRIADTGAGIALADLPPVSAPAGFDPVFPAVSSDGSLVAIARGNAAELRVLPGGMTVRVAMHGAPVTAIGLGAGDAAGAMVSGGADGSVMITFPGADQVELDPATAGIDAIAMLDRDRVFAIDARGHARLLDRSGVLADLSMPARIRMLRPSPDVRAVLAVPSSSGPVAPAQLIDLDRRAVIATLAAPPIFAARWVKGGRAILTAHADGTARIWGADGTLSRTFHGGTQFLADADADDSIVAGGGGDGTIRFWDIRSGRLLWSAPDLADQVLGVRIDGNDVVTRGSDGSISRCSLTTAGFEVAR